MVDDVEDLVGDGMAKVGRNANQEQYCQVAVSSDHDLFGKFLAECFSPSEQSKPKNVKKVIASRVKFGTWLTFMLRKAK
jgi:hypothetical protein